MATENNAKKRQQVLALKSLQGMIQQMERLRRQYKQYKIALNTSMHRFTGNNTHNFAKGSNYIKLIRKRTKGLFGKPLLRAKNLNSNNRYRYNSNNN
jgi:hypothetical protein